MNLEINIDIWDFQAGARKIEELSHKWFEGYEAGLDEFEERLFAKLIENINEEGLGSSNLASTVHINRLSEGFEIYVGADYAMYVEFGTGIVGSENPHPSPFIPWEYDVNGHGDDGWLYYDSSRKLRWTAGSPARPFMYKTWLWARRSSYQIITKHIRRAIKDIK